ncbi:GATA transcription factor 1 [Malania oleifera]|uniref:GATA transcription factor 1 n=1 Tax=Malania oleifera TaxID=397392 RepID=UPI0025AE3847|nr:GATA transcription factor 1 [Malania oleifera]
MEGLETAACFVDDLLNFSSDIGDDDDDDDKTKASLPSSTSILTKLDLDDSNRSFPEVAEEELEWLSNKDAFPEVETFVDILPTNAGSFPKQRSPVSVLETSNSNSTGSGNIGVGAGLGTVLSCCGSIHVPVRARSKRRRRRRRGFPDLITHQRWSYCEAKIKTPKTTPKATGRKCLHCQAEKTPQWRAGPLGPKTLCNACGVRYKSGRLLPEYRPASSPTFSSSLHSNSHRKVIEMRKLKQSEVVATKPLDMG